MKEWKLDSRTSGDIIRNMQETAANYTPEWNFNTEDPDVGSILAFVYGELLEDTASQLNRAGSKHQLAFFNSLGADLKRAVPARGYAVFRMAPEAPEGTEIPAGTSMTADLPEEEGGSVQFETEEDVYATPSRPVCLYLTDGRRDGIYRLSEDLQEQKEPLVLFREKGENLQAHELYLAHQEVFGIFGRGVLELGFYTGNGRLLDRGLLEKLTEPGTADFSYWDGEGWQEFASVSLLDGRICLRKEDRQPPFARMELGEEETYVVRCRILDLKRAGEISPEEIRIASRGERLEPQSVYGASVECSLAEYFPFGRRLIPFEEVYFGSEEALTKRGAKITLSFHLDFAAVPLEIEAEAEEIQWKWIMKQSEFRADPEFDVTIEEVIWEYFNGTGWNRLFPGKEYAQIFGIGGGALGQQKTLTFICPEDMSPILVNSCETCYIRARILRINNLYKMKGRYLVPVLGATAFSYSYEGVRRNPRQAKLCNNLEERLLAGKEAFKNQGSLFVGTETEEKALYLGFEQAPAGAPIRMLWLMEDTLLGQRGSLSWEYYGSRGWREMNLADGTRSLSSSGLVTFVGQQDFCRLERFGQSRYWIRLRDESGFYGEGSREKGCPVLKALWMNAVGIRHAEREEIETFTLDYFEEDCSFTLMRGNIDAIRVETLEGAREEPRWELWEEIQDLQRASADSRVYEVDRTAGVVRFGNGVHGQAPPLGREEGIRIHYKCGGGSRANVGAGQVGKLNQTLGFVTGVQNPEALWGGLDVEEPGEALRRWGAKLRHWDRAVTARDYEDLAREADRSLRKVRCFGGKNQQGEREPGAVTLVALPEGDWMDKSHSRAVQERIRDYLEPRMDPRILERKQFYVIGPKLVEVKVTVELVAGSFQDIFQVRRKAQERIGGFLDPVKGHFDGRGWAIGQFPDAIQIENALKEIPEIVQIQKVYLVTFISGPKGRQEIEPEAARRHPYILPVSGAHEVRVSVR